MVVESNQRSTRHGTRYEDYCEERFQAHQVRGSLQKSVFFGLGEKNQVNANTKNCIEDKKKGAE